MLSDKVKKYLREHRDEHLKGLCELLRFPSIANVKDPDGCGPCAEWLVEYLRRLGMEAELLTTGGRPCVFAELHVGADVPTLLVYAHYDVQPPEPLEAWRSGPFDPEVRDGCLFARGASDDKGQLFTHIMAVDALLNAGGGVPVNLKFLFEGEEEIGSPNIEALLSEQAKRFDADALVISDVGFFAENCPSIIYALRGMCCFEVTFTGANRDVHSGIEGGVIANPISALAKVLSAFHDADGRVAVPGYYDDVLPLSESERAAWAKLPFDESDHARELGLDTLAGGEKGYPVLERNWARPTLECNGIIGGHTAPGTKTIIPAQASAKISLRLVPNQNPDAIFPAIERFVAEHTPPGIRSQVQVQAISRPVLLGTDSPGMRAGKYAITEAFGRKPVLIRCGASVPVTEVFQRVLGLDAVMLGISLPEDNLHSPNERLKLEQLWRGAYMAAEFYRKLAPDSGAGNGEVDRV